MIMLSKPADSPLAGHTSSVMHAMDYNLADINIVVLSDSTGDETGEWPDLFTRNYMPAQYPAYTVTLRTFNTGTVVYNSLTTIQTGNIASPKTLAVYDGGASGQGAPYGLTNIATLIPVVPDVVIISYGHNDNVTATNQRKNYYQLIRAIKEKYPYTKILCIGQNPKTVGAANYANQFVNVVEIERLCGEMGIAFINVMRAYLDYNSYSTLLVDTTHPNSAGSALYLNEVCKYFIPRTRYTEPHAPLPQEDRKFLDANAFSAGAGTPNLAIFNPTSSATPSWALDKDTVESVSAKVDIPKHWGTMFDLKVYFGIALNEGGAHSVAWTYKFGNMVTGSPANAGSAGTFTAVADTQFRVAEANLTPSSPIIQASNLNPLMLTIQRVATDAADTVAQDAYFFGVLLTRNR